MSSLSWPSPLSSVGPGNPGKIKSGNPAIVPGPVGVVVVSVGSLTVGKLRGVGEGGGRTMAVFCGGCGCTDEEAGGGTVVSMATAGTSLVCVGEGETGGVSELEVGAGSGAGLEAIISGGIERTFDVNISTWLSGYHGNTPCSQH